MLEITTELLEHYLRATGTQYDRVKLAALIAKDGIEEAAFMYLDIVGIFRLGLCAAAESLLLWASEWQLEQEEYRPGDVIDERGIGLLREAAERQLTSAGIDPRAWESARKR